MNHRSLIQNVALFQGFQPTELEELTRTAIVHQYDTGSSIFHQGDPGTTLYIIIRGQVEIYLLDTAMPPMTAGAPAETLRARSETIVLQQMQHGDYFGELSLFDQKPRSAHARALNDVELLEITHAQIADCISRYPRAALTLLQTMADRLRSTDEMLMQRAAKNVDAEMEKSLGWADVLADHIAALNGSWAFILLLLCLALGWMILNSTSMAGKPFDPYPYVFFNLLLAILVSLQGPLIVMSQNRKSMLERARSEADYHVNLKNEVNIETLLHEIKSLRREWSDRKIDNAE
jgi:CRP/FNR family transcriptional regulator, cyclic AMP receptor protein